MLFLRSALFNLVFYLSSAVICIAVTPAFILPRGVIVFCMRAWSRWTMWLLRVIAGTRYELRGLENLPKEPALIASKHQSMWDTIIYAAILNDPAIVLKKELLYIPYYGWYSLKAQMVPVDRASGASALRNLIRHAKNALAQNRHLVIFPEGTRAAPGSRNPYKPGVAGLYSQLGIACVPVALNSGLYWPRRKFLRKPGTIVLEFLPPIPPGMNRKAFMAELEGRIEPATDKLLAEAGFSG